MIENDTELNFSSDLDPFNNTLQEKATVCKARAVYRLKWKHSRVRSTFSQYLFVQQIWFCSRFSFYLSLHLQQDHHKSRKNPFFNSERQKISPLKKLNPREAKFKSKPWITQGIRKSFKTKNTLFKHYITSTSQSNHSRYKIYKNKKERMIMQKPHGRVSSSLLALSVVNCPSQIDW